MTYRRGSPRNKYTGQRRLYLILAGVWLLVGFSLLGYAGYEFTANGKTPGQLIWVRPAQPAAPGDGQSPPLSQPVGTESFRLIIDKIGVDAPVSAYGLDENAAPQVPYEADLVAWYNFSSYPGNGENAVFAGHVTWRGDAVFKRLGEMQPGDQIKIQREDGSHLVYEVTESLLVEPSAQSAQDWMLPSGGDVITLITCGGERHLTDDFIGAEYDHRQVVRATLVAVA
jgi:LPXTG-site transpeptidase (sortase) family protein